jgi:hypothetical protein
MGRTHIAKGPAADDDTRVWAHRVSINRMSLASGIKFSRGPGQRVKAFLLRWNVDLKIVALKQLIRKFFNRSTARI